MSTFKEIERIIERYDGAVSALDGAVTQRIGDSIDAAYRNLERELRRLYPTWQSQGSLYAVQRRLLLLEELGDLLQVIRPEMRAEYEQLFTEALQIAHQDGGTMADELIRAREPGYPLQEFTSIPIEAAVLQARDGVERLYRYNDEFKSAVSGVVEQGLIQGWGAEKIARTLRGNEQMQGQFGVRQLKSKAETIARTEVMSAFNAATQQRYGETDIEFTQIFISPSENTCSYCLARNGNVYRLEEVTLPFHPRCRCIQAAWLPKWQERGWTDDAAVLASRKEALALLKDEGVKPNYGPTYWEKKAGLDKAPEAVWKPGQKARVKPPPPPDPGNLGLLPGEDVDDPFGGVRESISLPESFAISDDPRLTSSLIESVLRENAEADPEYGYRFERFSRAAENRQVQVLFRDRSLGVADVGRARQHILEQIYPGTSNVLDNVRKALRWAEANPGDPRAKGVRQKALLGLSRRIDSDPDAGGYTYENDRHVVVSVEPGLTSLTAGRDRLNSAAAPHLSAMEEAQSVDDLQPVTASKRLNGTEDLTLAISTMFHEVGHQIHFAVGTIPPPPGMKLPTRYGNFNEREHFAESFTMYMLDAEGYRQADPIGFEFIEQALEAVANGET